MKDPIIHFFAGIFIFMLAQLSAFSQITFDAEGDNIGSLPYHVVRIPAQGGTEFDLSKDFKVETRWTYRIRASVLLGKRHEISLLYAPLTIKSSGTLPEAIRYSGQTFAANTPLEGIYKFNSYRFTYRYSIVDTDRWRVALGVSAKVREANISLRSGAQYAEYPNLGFVPLVNFYFSFRMIDPVSVVVEGDALGTGKGRAEDIFAGLYAHVTKSLAIKGGYRLLEGGANVERNYNFTWVNYVAAGVVVSL